MELTIGQVRERLKDAGLKITPQRVVILEAVMKLGNHPAIESIIDTIRSDHPGIAVGTVYNVLDTLVDAGLIKRVKTEKDAMRFDGNMENHHHLYGIVSDKIEDFYDEELDQIIKTYFEKRKISNFEIRDITLQIKGNFK